MEIFNQEKFDSATCNELIMCLCTKCFKYFPRKKYNIQVSIKKNRINNFCCDSCKKEKNLKLRHCQICLKEFDSEYDNQRFCSHSCAAKFSNEKRSIFHDKCQKCNVVVERKVKRRICICQKCQLERRKYQPSYKKRPKYGCVCIICSNNFLGTSSKSKVCSKNCFSINARKNAICRNLGGETNYRKYTYNEIYFDSSWEVEIAKYLDEKSISWIRSREYNFTWKDQNKVEHRYYPDFYLPQFNVYLDPKNSYKLKQDLDKLKRVQEQCSIRIVYGHKNKIKNFINGLDKIKL